MEYYLWKRKRVTSEQKSIFYIAPSENIYGDYGRSRTWTCRKCISDYFQKSIGLTRYYRNSRRCKFRSSIGNCSFNFVRNDGNCDGLFYWRISCSSCSNVSGTGNSVSCHSDLCTCGNCNKCSFQSCHYGAEIFCRSGK